MTRRGFTLIELMIVIVIIGILAAIAIPNFIQIQNRAKETRVRGNCHAVQLAAEDFAVQNDGTYAADTDTDANLVGTTILDLLPGGVLIENPFTKNATEPQSSGAAATPGQTGYSVIVIGGANAGYTITGFGKTNLVITLDNGS